MDYKLTENYAVYDFRSFLPTENDPFPDNRVMDMLVTGPFVLKTDGAFETEHMYDRHKLLLEDYLHADGGEKNIVPRLGEKVTNPYFGDPFYVWQKSFIKWNAIRFDREEDACDPALYATEQRNAVYYTAFYIDCDRDEQAVLCYENSGSTLFVNGEETDFRPFGRVKGLWGLGYQRLISLHEGRNLILFKLRPGYIADTMDISISNCSVFPVTAECGGLLLSTPTLTRAYSGTAEEPRQIFPLFAAAKEDTDEAELCCAGETVKIPAMKKDECAAVRLSVPAFPEERTFSETVRLTHRGESAEIPYFFGTSPYDGFKGTEHVFSDFHFDTTYHQEQRTYALGAFHITKSILERLTENPDFKATLSEIDYLHPYYTLYPHHRQALRDAFREGRAEADCFYNQPNDLTSSGEAFVRNLVYGQLYHRDVLGRLSTVYAPGDVFGHFSQLSQIASKGGCRYVRWGKAMLGTDQLFRHVSPDGTALLHDKGFGRTDAKRLGVSACAASSDGNSYMEAFPREGDTDWMKQTVTKARFSVFSELAREVIASAETNRRENSAGDPILFSSRDITQHHSGVLLTRTDFKQANRLCENLLITAEKFAAAAFLYGADYPEKTLDKAWRQLLCAQHHDSVTGTNNEISFVDLMIEYRECAALASAVLDKAARFIASGVKTEDRESAVFLFNPCAWERGGECRFELPKSFNGKYAVLKDLKGKEYPVSVRGRTGTAAVPKIPATGYTLFRLEKRDEDPDAPVSGFDTVIENNRFRVTVDPMHGGGIISLYDKKEKKEWVDFSAEAPANMINVLRELHDRMETQHELYTTGQKLVSSDYTAEVRSEKCAAYQKLTIRVKLDIIAAVIQEITLFKNSDRIDFRTVIEDYNGEDDLFTVTFPMNIRGGQPVFEDRFSEHVSTRSKKYLSFQTHQYASFSGCRVLPANRWFGVSPTVFADMGNPGGVNLGMTAVIRCEQPGLRDCADRLLFALTKKGIPVTIYPDTEQHGGLKIIHFNEDVYSTDTRFVLCLQNDTNRYKETLLSRFTPKQTERIGKMVEKCDLACVYLRDPDNAYRKPVDVFLIIAKDETALSHRIAAMEKDLAAGHRIDMRETILSDLPPACDHSGAVLLNNGNIACSVERQSTLNLMLFHTASFYGNRGKVTGGSELVPEKKTHSFSYSLYPFRDSYREADVFRKAAEFNDRLFAVTDTAEGENAFLPEENAFLKVNGPFAVTAFKAGGFPLASMKNTTAGIERRGLTVRGFETDGRSGKVTIKTGFDIFGAQSADLLEEQPRPLKASGDSVSFPAPPHSVETVLLAPAPTRKIGSASLEALNTDDPIYIRSWEHDMGSMPEGYLTFAATLSKKPRKIDEVTTVIDLNTVNNSADDFADVTIAIECSEGLSADRTAADVSLAPGQFSVIPLTVKADRPDRKGLITIRWRYDGLLYTDVFEIGHFDPELSLELQDGKLVCEVKNPTDQRLDCYLYLASPIETWGDLSADPHAFMNISPFAVQFALAPGETTVYNFSVSADDSDYFKAFWAAAKLCCNGRIRFAFADRHGPRHNVWAHEFINEISKDNGSIRKLLDM